MTLVFLAFIASTLAVCAIAPVCQGTLFAPDSEGSRRCTAQLFGTPKAVLTSGVTTQSSCTPNQPECCCQECSCAATTQCAAPLQTAAQCESKGLIFVAAKITVDGTTGGSLTTTTTFNSCCGSCADRTTTTTTTAKIETTTTTTAKPTETVTVSPCANTLCSGDFGYTFTTDTEAKLKCGTSTIVFPTTSAGTTTRCCFGCRADTTTTTTTTTVKVTEPTATTSPCAGVQCSADFSIVSEADAKLKCGTLGYTASTTATGANVRCCFRCNTDVTPTLTPITTVKPTETVTVSPCANTQCSGDFANPFTTEALASAKCGTSFTVVFPTTSAGTTTRCCFGCRAVTTVTPSTTKPTETVTATASPCAGVQCSADFSIVSEADAKLKCGTLGYTAATTATGGNVRCCFRCNTDVTPTLTIKPTETVTVSPCSSTQCSGNFPNPFTTEAEAKLKCGTLTVAFQTTTSAGTATARCCFGCLTPDSTPTVTKTVEPTVTTAPCANARCSGDFYITGEADAKAKCGTAGYTGVASTTGSDLRCCFRCNTDATPTETKPTETVTLTPCALVKCGGDFGNAFTSETDAKLKCGSNAAVVYPATDGINVANAPRCCFGCRTTDSTPPTTKPTEVTRTAETTKFVDVCPSTQCSNEFPNRFTNEADAKAKCNGAQINIQTTSTSASINVAARCCYRCVAPETATPAPTKPACQECTGDFNIKASTEARASCDGVFAYSSDGCCARCAPKVVPPPQCAECADGFVKLSSTADAARSACGSAQFELSADKCCSKCTKRAECQDSDIVYTERCVVTKCVDGSIRKETDPACVKTNVETKVTITPVAGADAAAVKALIESGIKDAAAQRGIVVVGVKFETTADGKLEVNVTTEQAKSDADGNAVDPALSNSDLVKASSNNELVAEAAVASDDVISASSASALVASLASLALAAVVAL